MSLFFQRRKVVREGLDAQTTEPGHDAEVGAAAAPEAVTSPSSPSRTARHPAILPATSGGSPDLYDMDAREPQPLDGTVMQLGRHREPGVRTL